MNRLSRRKVSLGQANGPDVELLVEGDNRYASYETEKGFPVVYDDSLGLFCYAQLREGRFESTEVPVAERPPANSPRHGSESDAVRREKIAASEARRTARGQTRKVIGSTDSGETT